MGNAHEIARPQGLLAEIGKAKPRRPHRHQWHRDFATNALDHPRRAFDAAGNPQPQRIHRRPRFRPRAKCIDMLAGKLHPPIIARRRQRGDRDIFLQQRNERQEQLPVQPVLV